MMHDGSYAQWVGQAVAMARARDGDVVSLFESSVPEPRELLRQAVVQTADPEFSRYYVSAFAGGNPFVREMLAAQYGVTHDEVLCTTGATGGLALNSGMTTGVRKDPTAASMAPSPSASHIPSIPTETASP